MLEEWWLLMTSDVELLPTGLYPSAQMKREMQELKALLREALNASSGPPHPFGWDLYERIQRAVEE